MHPVGWKQPYPYTLHAPCPGPVFGCKAGSSLNFGVASVEVRHIGKEMGPLKLGLAARQPVWHIARGHAWQPRLHPS